MAKTIGNTALEMGERTSMEKPNHALQKILHTMIEGLRKERQEKSAEKKQIGREINILTADLDEMKNLCLENIYFADKLRVNLSKLYEYSQLEYNWNDNGAEPFNRELLNLAWKKINELYIQPKVFPTACGSIQFEYEKENEDYLEFQIFEDRIEVFEILNSVEKEFTIAVSDDLNKFVTAFYGISNIHFYNRGHSYTELNQYNKAVENFTKAIEIEPNDADAYCSRGIFYAVLEQYDKAIQDFTKVREIEPDNQLYRDCLEELQKER